MLPQETRYLPGYEHDQERRNFERTTSGTLSTETMQCFSRLTRDKQWKYVKNYANEAVQPTSVMTIKDMPRPKALPIIGTQFEFFTSGGGTKLHEYIDMRHKNLGPIFCETLGGSELVFISDTKLIKSLFLNLEGKHPEHILPEPWLLYEKIYGSKRGLLFMRGEEWLTNRRIMNKYLLRDGSEKWLEEPIKRTVKNFIQKWKKKSENGKLKPDLESEFYRLSLDVIMAVLLGNNSSLKTSIHYEELLSRFSDSVKKIFHITTRLYGLPVHWCQRFNLKVWQDFTESVDTSLFLAQKLVLEMLIKENDSNCLISKLKQENITEETIKRIIADFVIAAGDTTTYTLLWSLFLVSKHEKSIKSIQEKGIADVKFIIKESMRLYPVAPFLTRILPKDGMLGPYKLKEGTPIIASIYTSGRDEKNFSKAEAFLPYRWDRSDSRKEILVNHVPSATLPFAMGARSCIGRKIAMVTLTEALHQIVANFDVKCANTNKINAVTSQILIPHQPIELILTKKDTEELYHI